MSSPPFALSQEAQSPEATTEWSRRGFCDDNRGPGASAIRPSRGSEPTYTLTVIPPTAFYKKANGRSQARFPDQRAVHPAAIESLPPRRRAATLTRYREPSERSLRRQHLKGELHDRTDGDSYDGPCAGDPGARP